MGTRLVLSAVVLAAMTAGAADAQNIGTSGVGRAGTTATPGATGVFGQQPFGGTIPGTGFTPAPGGLGAGVGVNGFNELGAAGFNNNPGTGFAPGFNGFNELGGAGFNNGFGNGFNGANGFNNGAGNGFNGGFNGGFNNGFNGGFNNGFNGGFNNGFNGVPNSGMFGTGSFVPWGYGGGVVPLNTSFNGINPAADAMARQAQFLQSVNSMRGRSPGMLPRARGRANVRIPEVVNLTRQRTSPDDVLAPPRVVEIPAPADSSGSSDRQVARSMPRRNVDDSDSRLASAPVRQAPATPQQTQLVNHVEDIMQDRPLTEGTVVDAGASRFMVRFQNQGMQRTESFPLNEVIFFRKSGEMTTAALAPGQVGEGSRVLIPIPSEPRSLVAGSREEIRTSAVEPEPQPTQMNGAVPGGPQVFEVPAPGGASQAVPGTTQMQSGQSGMGQPRQNVAGQRQETRRFNRGRRPAR